MWVITSSHNDYSQHGDYLIAVFFEKPEIAEIASTIDCSYYYAQQLYKGGGRQNLEDVWYHLTELKSGQLYKHH
jgi:hypothetical protein